MNKTFAATRRVSSFAYRMNDSSSIGSSTKRSKLDFVPNMRQTNQTIQKSCRRFENRWKVDNRNSDRFSFLTPQAPPSPSTAPAS